MDRLNKKIAASGVASRRKADELILEKRVKVNGIVVTELGSKVNPNDIIMIDDKVINEQPKQYFVINKPAGVVTTLHDPFNRKTIIDIIPDEYKKYRLFPVGRLDYDTKGIIILTNDGKFMNEMVGPQSGVEKEYLVRVDGILKNADLKKLANGVTINNHKTLPAIVLIKEVDDEHNSTLIDITITEGKYHQVKEMFKAIGYDVKKLIRIRFGNLSIEKLKPGEIRRLSIHDVRVLHELSKKNKILNINEVRK